MKRANAEFRRLQGMDRKSFQVWQDEARWAIARHHFESNKTYRSLFSSGLPERWESLPVVQKANLQGNLEDLITSPLNKHQIHVGSTSGSSGHPFYYAKDRFAHAMTYALIANRYGWHGLSLNQKQARFYGIPLSGSSRLVEQTKDLIANRVRFPVFDLSDEKLKKFSLSFASQKFNYLYGYTSALILFAQYLVTENRVLKQICPSLSACIVTSEVCTSENKNLLELAFGIPVLNEYGASELDVIAFTDKSGDWILSEENLFVEILDENNQPAPYGQEGKIVITSLHNRAFPMVRYEIGDIGSIERAIKCRLLHLSGRTNDVIKLPSGKKAAGLTFYYVSRSILESGGALKEFVIKQTSLDTFVFEVVADSPIPPDSEMKIRSAMKLYLEDGLNLKINRVAKIDRPIAGKIKHFYSLIQ